MAVKAKFPFWAVVLSLGFMLILSQTRPKPVRFSLWKEGPGDIRAEVYDVTIHFQDVKEDPVGVFVQFPDRSYQFVPLTAKPAWRK